MKFTRNGNDIATETKRIDEGVEIRSDYDNMLNGGGGGVSNRSYSNIKYYEYFDDKELILRYRTMATFTDVSTRIRKIVNHVIVNTYTDAIMKLKFREPHTISDSNLEKYYKSYKEYLTKMDDLNDDVEAMFRQWFIDGRMYIRKIRDDKKKIINYDILHPYNIRKKISSDRTSYIWEAYDFEAKKFIEVDNDDIIYATSGEYDGITPVSFLHDSMKAAYELNMLKNALLIHRVVRAPLRYAIYIDVGTMDPDTAYSLINRYKNEYNLERFFDGDTLVANASQMLMSENFWFSRHGDKNTELDTVGGDVNVSDIEDVNMFVNDLNNSMQIPKSLMDSDDGGGDIKVGDNIEEMTQDERDFRRYYMKLRYRFSFINKQMFIDHMLESGIKQKEIDEMKSFITFEFSEDEHIERVLKYTKYKLMAETLDELKPIMGMPTEEEPDRFPLVSVKQVLSGLFGLTEDDIKKTKKQIIKESKEGYWWFVEKED